MSNRYLPQIRVEEIGTDGQNLLALSSVFIVGCGALGSPLAMQLAGAGVGNIILADFDTIDLSNLHRQNFYTEDEVGLKKSVVLSQKLKALNSDISVESFDKLVTRKFLQDFRGKVSIVADCADNPETTYLLDDFCYTEGIPLCTAGISGWRAQIFNFIPGSMRYSDVFTKPDNPEQVLPCSIAGILGSTAGFASSLQASQIIKTILGLNKESLLINADLLSNEFQTMSPL